MRKLRHEEIPRIDPGKIGTVDKHPIRAVLDNVRSIHNVGSIFRSSDAARIEHLHLTGYTGTPDNPSIHKTSLGAEESVPWSHDGDISHVLVQLRRSGYRIAVVEITDQPTFVDELTVDDFPLAIVLGNEVDGVSADVVAEADIALEIPQFGIKQSLNVAVAYGVIAMDLVRRYRLVSGLPVTERPAAEI